MKKLTVNKDACIGCGLCLGLADAVFAFNDDGKVSVVADVTADDEDAVQSAAASCPVEAIEVEDSFALSIAVGKSGRMSVAILNQGFAKKIKEKLGVGDEDGKNE